MTNPDATAWFAQDFKGYLKTYDYTVVMAYAAMEGKKDSRKWYRELFEAAGGREALNLIHSHPGRVDLLLTDIVMPEMTGRRLAETLAAEHRSLRVIYMSGYTDEAIVRHGVLEPGLAFIQKPFRLEDLKVALDALLK